MHQEKPAIGRESRQASRRPTSTIESSVAPTRRSGLGLIQAATVPAPVPHRRASARTRIAYTTPLGSMYESSIEKFLVSKAGQAARGTVDLAFTSPPFPLNREKAYGNKVGEEYLEWLGQLARPLGDLLSDTGSLVVELGNAWEPREPVMSTLVMKALLRLVEDGEFFVCQQFIAHNPARLPSPVEWVNKERIRVKDSYTNVWWMSRTPRPKADNRRVLVEYSSSMKALLKRQSYNAGNRPSEHVIGETSFLTDHGGAIPPSVLEYSNTHSNDPYRAYCMERGLKIHPARMPAKLADFFVRFLTEEGDLVLDPFGGSNTTGAMAESLGRRWIAVEPNGEYIEGSKGRFVGTPVRERRR